MNQQHTNRAEWRSRIGTFALGVAIGLMFLGFYWQGRTSAARREAAEQQAKAAAESKAAEQAGTPVDRPRAEPEAPRRSDTGGR
jgi:hypothetical protein